MRRRIGAFVFKEFIHIVRDLRTLLVILLMPILMIVLYGYAITLDMRNIRYTVIDQAGTRESRELVRHFANNGFFLPVPTDIVPGQAEHLFRTRAVSIVFVIPRDFSLTLRTERTTKVQMLVDASDANVGTFINNYSNQVVRLFNEEHNGQMPVILTLEPHILYNAEMKSSNFFVPGLVALILMLINALLTSITITREKETGTMEQILVSPVHPIEIIVGKVVPYIALGFINAAMILVVSKILFDVPFSGSILLLAAFSFLYILVALSFGLMISSIVKTQQAAMLITLMATILPTIMLSGFIFPIPSMPLPLQYLSRLIPATYFLTIIRGIMLKGVGLAELWLQASVLAAEAALILFVATRRFQVTLDT